ncbi:uncharacterized protein LOC113238684 [Hyposmocoma kahamanoa]|uniref:uncharacterized protein LOC113238684 n=1 Tax=Hyposmocoma kahamanoa TaxID=1477025 RepID=UPI000E6D8F43|nr:uncharacterized protein LOC113238684 [Hyposmocoma kahamanoa]
MDCISAIVVPLTVLVNFWSPVYMETAEYTEVPLNDSEVIRVCEAAFAFYKTMQPAFDSFAFHNVIKAERMIDDGYLYRVTFNTEYADNHQDTNLYCNAIVKDSWEFSDNLKTQNITCEPAILNTAENKESVVEESETETPDFL